jgi:hypothetical protein
VIGVQGAGQDGAARVGRLVAAPALRHHRGAAVSITGGNLHSNLWPELAMWQRYSPLLMRLFEHKGEAITSVRPSENVVAQARAFAADADKASRPSRCRGLHNEYVTILLDGWAATRTA